jgi:hypothetical protein
MKPQDKEVEEITVEWLLEQIAPNKGNSPLIEFNKKRLDHHYRKKITDEILENKPEKKTHKLGTYTQEELGRLEQDVYAKLMYDEGWTDALDEYEQLIKEVRDGEQ